MKSIALIFTRSKEKTGQGTAIQRPMIPQPLICLGSYLHSKGIKVYLIDGQVCDPKKELDKIIEKVDLIGFSVMTMQVANSLEINNYIKKNYPNKKIIWGGIHPSLLPEQTIQDPTIDYVCQREGEECLYELAKGISLNKIKNLVYKKDGKIIINPLRKFLDMNKLPSPNWELLGAQKYIFDYQLGGVSRKGVLPLLVGRGCAFNCAFCVNTVLGRTWRSLSVKKMIKEIELLKNKYNLNHIALCDDCFDIDMKRVEEFCKTLVKEKLNITWDCSARAGFHWTDEIMELMRDAGCIAISIGAESGSKRILNKVIHKPATIESTLFIARQCNKYGISLISSWMCGIPSETEEELKQTINLLKKVTKICPSCSIHGPQPFKAYPNSELYFEAVKSGFETPSSLREWAKKSERGFIEDSYLLWVKNPTKLRAIEFYCMNSFRDPRNFLQKILITFSRFRLKRSLWYLPFEMPFAKFYVSKIQSFKPILRQNE